MAITVDSAKKLAQQRIGDKVEPIEEFIDNYMACNYADQPITVDLSDFAITPEIANALVALYSKAGWDVVVLPYDDYKSNYEIRLGARQAPHTTYRDDEFDREHDGGGWKQETGQGRPS